MEKSSQAINILNTSEDRIRSKAYFEKEIAPEKVSPLDRRTDTKVLQKEKSSTLGKTFSNENDSEEVSGALKKLSAKTEELSKAPSYYLVYKVAPGYKIVSVSYEFTGNGNFLSAQI